MKKSITIPKIEEELYNNVKAKAEENNQSVSEYVSQIFNDAINCPNSTVVSLTNEISLLKQRIADYENSNDDLHNSKNDLILEKERLEKENNLLNQKNYDLEEKNKEKDSKIKALTEDCVKFDEQREQMKAEIKSLQENQPKSDNPNSVTLQFEDFDFAVLKYCLDKFNAETGKNFNESELLKYMFTEYAVKGSIYFFKTPGYFRLKEIQKQVEEQKQNHNNE